MKIWTSRTGVSRGAWRVLPAVVLTAIVVACGGGYGGGSSYTSPGPTTGPAGVSVGAITGFGSVHVNGKKFQTSGTRISIDGQIATQADLRVGDVIEVKGHHDSTTNTDVADEIEMHSNVQGPVSAIDATNLSMTVLGQKVVVSSATSFDDSISPASLAGIKTGDILEVSGMTGASGEIQATRIERKPAGALFHVIGTASATDATAKTLMINALGVDYSAAALVDFPASGPKDGDLVEADGASLGSAGELKATRLELRSGKELKADVDGDAEVEGLITRFGSSTDFDVGGRTVSTSSATTFEGGAAGDLALNVRVEVEGAVDASGVVAATRVRIERPAGVCILAQVDSVNAAAGTVTVLGIQVSVTDMTRFEDHSGSHVDTFSLADVHTGDWLEIRGSESPAGSNMVVATRLERQDGQAGVRLAGPVKAAAQPAFTILTVSIATTATTQFVDGSGAATTADAFFGGLVGQTAAVTGSWDGTTLTAAKASLHGESEIDGEGEGDGH